MKPLWKRCLLYFIVPYYRALSKDLKNTDLVFDVGCGVDSCLNYVLKTPRRVGIEGNPKNHKIAFYSGNYEYVYKADILDVLKIYSKKIKTLRNFDVVLLSDVIEHLPKKKALRLIDFSKAIAPKVIVFTPLGFLKQIDKENPLNSHRSGWNEKELKKLGFKTRIIKNFNEKAIYGVWTK